MRALSPLGDNPLGRSFLNNNLQDDNFPNKSLSNYIFPSDNLLSRSLSNDSPPSNNLLGGSLLNDNLLGVKDFNKSSKTFKRTILSYVELRDQAHKPLFFIKWEGKFKFK